MASNSSAFTENHRRKRSGGGTTCCIVGCVNNTNRNHELSFHKFPKEKRLSETWIHWAGMKDFQPSEHDRICGAHFPGGKKTYMNNIPYETPKLIKPTPSQPRSTVKCRKRITFSEASIENKENTDNSLSVQEYTAKITRKDPADTITRLENELHKLRLDNQVEIDRLKEEMGRKFSIERFRHLDTVFQFYTGFPNYAKFKAFYNYLSPSCTMLRYFGSINGELTEGQQKRGRKRSMSPEQELFMVLARLRCNLLEQDLAIRLNIYQSQVSNIWITWLDFLYRRLRAINIWPSRALIDRTMPKSFKEHHPQTRVIIDCTEIFTEMPSAPITQSVTFSSYKHHNTAKGLIGISPAGKVTFVSELYCGRTSDKQLTMDCGILDLLKSGLDEIMADRGFNIESDLPERVSLNIPPFLGSDGQLGIENEVKTRRIARQRIHVERTIGKIKIFRILHQVMPLSMAADLSKIWIICCYLTLLTKPLSLSED